MHGVHEGRWHFDHGRVGAQKSFERKKHQTLTSQKRSSASFPDFFGISSQRPATKSHDAKVVSKSTSSESGEHSKLNATKTIASSSGSSVMEKSVTRDETLKAEILWALKAIMSHYSFKSCKGTSKLFQAMFPDSRIASWFSCEEKKFAFLIWARSTLQTTFEGRCEKRRGLCTNVWREP